MGAAMRYQPQASIRLNRANPITRGLVVVLHPMQPGINLADGSAIVDPYGQGQSWTLVANPLGRALTNSPSMNYRLYSNSTWPAPQGSTTAMVAIPRALVTSGVLLLEWSGTGGWNTVSLYMGDGTNPRWRAGTNASGLQYTSASSNYAVGTPYTVVATATSSAQNLIINGVIAATTAYATGNPQLPHSFALDSPSSAAKAIEINLTLVWNRALSNDEAISLSQNPWQLFDAGSSSSAYQAAIASSGGAPGSLKSFSYSASGGAVFGGSASRVRSISRAPVGSLAITGSGQAVCGAARVAQGGMLFSGTAPTSFHAAVQSRVVSAAGGLLIRGAAVLVRAWRRLASGSITWGGTSTAVVTASAPPAAALFCLSTLMRADVPCAHATISNAAINRTANLL